MQFDTGLFVWTLLAFGVLYVLLSLLVFRPLRAAMDVREEVFAVARRAGETAKQAAQHAEKEGLLHVECARKQVRHLITEGHRHAEETRRQTRGKAREQADQLVDNARQQISREVVSSLEALKPTVADLSLQLSREFLRNRADPAQHRKLADDFVDRLKKSQMARR